MFHAPAQPLPEEIRVEETVDGVRYMLPVRTLGVGHVFGAFVVMVGAMIVCAACLLALARLNGNPASGFPLIAHLMLPVTFFLIGIVIWVFGLFVAMGRADLELRGTNLLRVERAGFLRWTNRNSMSQLHKLWIEIGLVQDKTLNEALGPGLSVNTLVLSSLVGEYESGKKARFLVGYSSVWLEAIAHDLAGRIAQHPARQSSAVGSERPEVLVQDSRQEADARGDDIEPIALPSESAIEVVHTRDGLTITVPPIGLWCDRKGAFSAGAAWNGFMATVAGGMFGFMSMPWYINVVIAVVWCGSILIMLAVVAVGRRSAIIDVVDETLLITQRSLMGIRQRNWARHELQTIDCVASGMEVNEQPVMQLQIVPVSGASETFFTGREEQELRWLAQVLRETLKLSDRAG